MSGFILLKQTAFVSFFISFIVSLVAFGVAFTQAAEWQPLQNRSQLWNQLQDRIDSRNKPSVKGFSLASREEPIPESQLKFNLVKTLVNTLRFEHYDTEYQGYPIVNGRIIIVQSLSGEIQQVLGSLVSGIEADLPNAKAAFALDERKIKHWLLARYRDNSVISKLKIAPVIYLEDGTAKAVYLLSFLRSNQSGQNIERPQMLVSAQGLQVLKQWDVLDNVLVMAGGAGGNEQLGLHCYTPSPDLMVQCLSYQSIEEPLVSEVIFLNNNPNNIFKDFSGYPFIVTKEEGDCWLKNDYVTTIKADKSNEGTSKENDPFQYPCGVSNEHFDKQGIDDDYWNYYSYFPVNDAHFYAGIVMQMYDQYLAEIYPNQLEDCPLNSNDGYCLKPISQRANAKGLTGGDMSNANWDGEYVNYGNGGPNDMYSHTTIDLVAHEISHAITEWNSDPIWAGQSRALDESFSDIAAIAVNDYFERHLSGSYANSEPYQNKRKKRWVYGTDVFLYALGGRDFQLPSRFGGGIGDARDYDSSMSGHAAGGVMNKLFYELVVRYQWSIEETFKLMLEANVSCWSTQVVFTDAGTCLLLLTDEVNKLKQLDQALHSVGIFSEQSNLDALPFTVKQHENRIEYQIILSDRLMAEEISAIEISWGKSTLVESWSDASNLDLNTFLSRSHDYVDDGDQQIAIKLSLKNGSILHGFRNLFIASEHTPEKDDSPNAFEFPSKVDVELSTLVTSQAIEVTRINTAAVIKIDTGQYAIDGGEFTSESGRVMNGQNVVIQLLSSASYNKNHQAKLTIGDVSAIFEVRTLNAKIDDVAGEDIDEEASSSGGVISLFELICLALILMLFCQVESNVRKQSGLLGIN